MKSIAEKKKSQNIAEYIIYMYQMEDLIRAYNFNMEEIRQFVISHYPISDTEKDETRLWFASICEQMISEKITTSGHLSNVQDIVDDLAKIHWTLLKTDKEYFDTYNSAKPYVIEMIMEAGDKPVGNEIQVCLNAIYGLLLAKLKGREIPKGYTEATEAFGNVLSYLSFAYANQK
ncbi:DUF4924 family protein [Belliella aquatica]|uniref:DUF4924 domain-containing protein n=1 Tax=Belliella aquatica TaxID=1323734 RepID=A0ABQ1N0U0_9BACT|nr:DUF4924 family protein [Belliella aquatica]MCH7406975.1 DUF4924 family protein [Belliella aquatica]GGC50812.1 DUF4924 domain-containing protein [Belliella aquatica]